MSEFATEGQKESVQNSFRQIGLGIMGWSDCLKLIRFPYCSNLNLRLIEDVGMVIANAAYCYSEKLAEEKGACGVWEEIKDRVTGNPFERWYDPNTSDCGGNNIPGNEVPNNGSLHQYPRRNSTILSIAPTGSIAQLAGCSWAFEPDFGLAISKQVYVDASKLEQQWVPMVSPYLEDLGLSEADKQIVISTGSLQSTQFAKDNPELAKVFLIANEIPFEWHIKVQAAWQKWVDSSCSKTINMPESATIEQIKKVYKLAHELGLKGITIYRQGTLESEPIKVGNKIQENEVEESNQEYVTCKSGLCEL